jgi:predicted small secreted protein
MNTIKRSFTLLMLAAAITLGLSACNTFRGIGKDTQAVGEKIEDKADEKQHEDQPNRS